MSENFTYRFTIPFPGRTSTHAFEEARKYLCSDPRTHYATTNDARGQTVLIVIGYDEELATIIKLRYTNAEFFMQDSNGRFVPFKKTK